MNKYLHPPHWRPRIGHNRHIGGIRFRFFPKISAEATIEEIESRIADLLQNGQPGDRFRVQGLPQLFFLRVGAKKAQPACVIPCVGYPYKQGRLFLRSMHNLNAFSKLFGDPNMKKFMEAFLKLFPQFTGQDDEANPDANMLLWRKKGLE